MEQQIKEIISRIDALEKLINVIQQNLNSNIQSFLACLALIVATTGVALVYYVKSTVNKRVEKELIAIKNSIKSELIGQISIDIKRNIQMEKENIKSELYSKLKTDLSLDLIDYINRTKPIFWASSRGTQVIGSPGNYILNIYGLNMSSELDKTIISLEVTSSLTGRKITCNYNPSVSNGTSITANLLDYNKEKDGQFVDWKIVWINGKL